MAQLVKNPPAMWETWVPFLGWEDSLEKGKATHSSILAWRIHGLCSPWGGKEPDTTEKLAFPFQAVGASSPAFSLDFLRACHLNWQVQRVGHTPSTRPSGPRHLLSVLKMSSAPRAQVSLGERWGSQMLSHENSPEPQSILSFLTSC